MEGAVTLAKLREISAAEASKAAGIDQREVEVIGEGYNFERGIWWVQTRGVSNGVEHHDMATKADDSPEFVRMHQTIAV